MEFSTDDFDGSERANLRELLSLVRGNGKPGLNARVRRIEWLGWIILAGLISMWLEGRIRFHQAEPPAVEQPQMIPPNSVPIQKPSN